jgi:hypothetical protein
MRINRPHEDVELLLDAERLVTHEFEKLFPVPFTPSTGVQAKQAIGRHSWNLAR